MNARILHIATTRAWDGGLMRRAGTFGSKPQSVKQARSALTNLLYFCTPERLQSFTAAHLAATHRVPLPEVERMLVEARKARAA